MANRLGMEALMKINERALALQTADKGAANARYRMNFGIFNYNQSYDKTARMTVAKVEDNAKGESSIG